jgi:O-antigen ligase
LKYFEYFMVYFMVTNNLKDMKQIKTFIFFMLLVGVIAGVYGLYSYFIEGLRATAPFEGEGGEANTLAGYLIIIMSLTLGMFLYNYTALGRFLLGCLFLFLAVPFMFTLSRAGWLGFIPMLITFIIVSKRGKALLLFCLLVSILIAPVFLPKPVTQRFHATFAADSSYKVMGRKVTLDESTAIRIRTWKGSLAKWAKRPILGHGIPGGGVVSDVQYTRILREVGIVGFLAFLWVIARLFKAGFANLNSARTDDFTKGISLGFIAGLMGILTMGVGAEVFIIIRIMEPFWFLAAIVVMLPEIEIQEKGEVV